MSSMRELAWPLALAALYAAARLAGVKWLTAAAALALGCWLVYRPSEWAAEGMESLGLALGFSSYTAGVLSSLASNLPEIVMSSRAAYTGVVKGVPQMVDLAVLSILSAIGFNMMLLGAVIVLSTRGRRSIPTPPEALAHELELMRFSIVAMLLISALGAVSSIPPGGALKMLPREAAALLVASYIAYVVFMLREGREGHGAEGKELRHSIALAAAGFAGIAAGSELIVDTVEGFLHLEEVAGVSPVVLGGVVIGGLGSIPEHMIAIVQASKGALSFSLGNLVSGLTQSLLLILGGIGVFIPIALDEYVVFQLMVAAGSLWFLKRSMVDDGKLDLYEGVMVLLVQLLVFSLLLRGHL
ncbi:MAG: hypothetical protein DRN96_05695 [Thermoproteota archaeon]|nr:MAG: hypothetical protein DRN96_05695 [Candidatus Korarchaeota archaeon]